MDLKFYRKNRPVMKLAAQNPAQWMSGGNWTVLWPFGRSYRGRSKP